MNAKQQALVDELTSQIDERYRQPFAELAEYAVSLGYSPVRNKTRELSIDFRSGRVKETIMKMELREQPHDDYKYGARGLPGLRLKFYAAPEYSEVFRRGVQRVIEGFGGRYTGCYGCGRCNGKPQGYVYVYPDGKKVFRCGCELISVFDFEDRIEEIKSLLLAQAQYFEKWARERA